MLVAVVVPVADVPADAVAVGGALVPAARAEFPGMGRFFCSAKDRVVVPPGPLGGGAVPVPPVKSTWMLTPAGPQGPEVPAMLHRVATLVFPL